ncbi:MAG: tRNA pseudouridine(55) synthase TruB [Deltaproteobacteria bacterium]|nr:MAG: tRNA pseudouridine(55) synthase TruB [Deltaproteobacteria bacterium]
MNGGRTVSTGFGLLLDKPPGASSHDLVDFVRYALRGYKVGHAGTLDPFATGLLLVLVGDATKAMPFVVGHDKRYVATVVLGAATDTGDPTGTVVDARPVPDRVWQGLSEVVAGLVGTLHLRPPAYAAVKVGGVAAHVRARRGESVPLEARPMEIHDAELLRVDPARCEADLALHVGAGTYVRSLAEHLGERLGVPAHTASLRRVAIGRHTVDDPRTVGPWVVEARGRDRRGKPRVRVRPCGLEGADRDRLAEHLVARAVSLDELLDLPVVDLPDADVGRLARGQPAELPAWGAQEPAPPKGGNVLVRQGPGGRGAGRIVARWGPEGASEGARGGRLEPVRLLVRPA